MLFRNPVEYLSNPDEPREVSADRFFIEAVELFAQWYNPNAYPRLWRVHLWLNEEGLWEAQAGIFHQLHGVVTHEVKGWQCHPPRATISEAVNSVQRLGGFRTRKHRTRIKPEQEASIDQLLRFLLGLVDSRQKGKPQSRISIGAVSSWSAKGRRVSTTFEVAPYWLTRPKYYAHPSCWPVGITGAENVSGKTLEEALLNAAAALY